MIIKNKNNMENNIGNSQNNELKMRKLSLYEIIDNMENIKWN